MKLFSQESETLLANIGSLTDQLKQLQEGEDYVGDPLAGGNALVPEELEGEEDVDVIFAKLVDGQPLASDELEQLGEATAGGGELIEDLIAKLVAGQELTEEELVILRAAIDGEGEEVAEAQAVVKAIVERSLQGVPREAAVPLLSGIAGLNRAGRLVQKRFPDWETARKDTSSDPDLVQLLGAGDSRVAKDLPATLGVMGRRLGAGDGEEDEEDDNAVLEQAVRKLQQGEGLTEQEFMELSAANLQGRPLSLAADLPVHKEMRTFNRTLPIESLQQTWGEVDRMVREASRSSFLKGPPSQGRHGLRKEIVRKSLGLAISSLFQGSRV